MVAPEELFELKRFIEKQLGIELQPWQLTFLEQLLFNPEVKHDDQLVYQSRSVFDTIEAKPFARRIMLAWETIEKETE